MAILKNEIGNTYGYLTVVEKRLEEILNELYGE